MSQALPYLRVLDIGASTPLYSQAVYHGIAVHMRPDDAPVLVLTRPTSNYVCIGAHQDAGAELDLAFCRQQGLAVIRRQVGGGTVLLGPGQLFFHFVFPRRLAPRRPSELYPYFIEPVLRGYRALGIEAYFQPPNDIQVGSRRIGGTGAAHIGSAAVVVGSFLFDFDHALMSRIVRAPSPQFRAMLARLLPKHITTIAQESGHTRITEQALKSALLSQLQSCLGLQARASRPSPAEQAAIAEAEEELVSDDGWQVAEKKAVSHGIKLRAGVYLTEYRATVAGQPLRRLLLQQDNIITELELPGASPEWQALGQRLTGAPLHQEALLAALGGTLEARSAEQFCHLILAGAQREMV